MTFRIGLIDVNLVIVPLNVEIIKKYPFAKNRIKSGFVR
jgi:hypothetical protein